MYPNKTRLHLARFTSLALLSLFFVLEAYGATTGNLPFNRTLDTFRTNFMAAIFVILVVLWVATMLMMAFGEWGDGVKRVLNILCWASLALAGPAGVTALFGVGALI
jgi:DMSO/TMAO reductase YedYZ heme-binding membrane subunit